MTDPYGPGKCAEANLNTVMAALSSPTAIFNPNSFLNPQEINILNMRQGNDGAWARYFAAKNLLLLSPEDAPHLAQLETAWQKLPDMISAYETWTNFLSGKSHVFPLPGSGLGNVLDLDKIYGNAGLPKNQQWFLLGTVTFAGVLGIVHSSRRQEHVTCNTDPNDPCAKVGGVFGAILGAFNAVLGAIADGLNQIQGFIGKVRDIIDKIEGYIGQLARIVAQALDKLIGAIMDAIKYGLAKLLKALGLDPCMGQVLGQICGIDLKTAIGL